MKDRVVFVCLLHAVQVDHQRARSYQKADDHIVTFLDMIVGNHQTARVRREFEQTGKNVMGDAELVLSGEPLSNVELAGKLLDLNMVLQWIRLFRDYTM